MIDGCGQLALTWDVEVARRFEEFHAANPDVYRLLVRLASQWVSQTGQRKLGMKALFERARWEIALSTNDPDFKLNNTYTAYYARLIMAQEPHLANLFDLRASEADDWIAGRL